MEMGPEIVAARLVLGIVFLASGIGKLRSVGTLADSIRDYRLLPSRAVPWITSALPPLEIALGFLCIAGALLGPAGIVALLLLLAFSGAISINLVRGRKFPCNCFGSSRISIGPAVVFRNFLLAGLAALIIHQSRTLVDPVAFVTAWHDDVHFLLDSGGVAPLIATVCLSLSITFLLGEIEPSASLSTERG